MRTAKGRAIVRIDPEACLGCGLCVPACRAGCLDFAPELNSRGGLTVQYAGAGCLGDGACMSACPADGAIAIHREAPPAHAGSWALEPA